MKTLFLILAIWFSGGETIEPPDLPPMCWFPDGTIRHCEEINPPAKPARSTRNYGHTTKR